MAALYAVFLSSQSAFATFHAANFFVAEAAIFTIDSKYSSCESLWDRLHVYCASSSMLLLQAVSISAFAAVTLASQVTFSPW